MYLFCERSCIYQKLLYICYTVLQNIINIQMAKIKTKNTKSVQVYLPADVHEKCYKIKAHRFINTSKEPTFPELVLEMIEAALMLPKYSQVNTNTVSLK